MAALRRSEKHYRDTITFQVDDVLFKVAKWYFVKHSSVFRDMFSVPQPAGQVDEGSNDDHPLVLEGVKAKDFEELLDMMYPEPDYPLPQDLVTIIEPEQEKAMAEAAITRYSACIELSRKWFFHRIHAESIKRLEKYNLSPVDKIVLGRQHHVAEWIRRGCHELMARSERLSKAEAERLGPTITVGIGNLREEICEMRADVSNLRIQMLEPITSAHPLQEQVMRSFVRLTNVRPISIDDIFQDELKLADSMNSAFYASLKD